MAALPWSAQPPRALHLGGVRIGAPRASRQGRETAMAAAWACRWPRWCVGAEARVAGVAQPRLGHGIPRLRRSRTVAAASPRRPTAGLARDFATGVITLDLSCGAAGRACCGAGALAGFLGGRRALTARGLGLGSVPGVRVLNGVRPRAAWRVAQAAASSRGRSIVLVSFARGWCASLHISWTRQQQGRSEFLLCGGGPSSVATRC